LIKCGTSDRIGNLMLGLSTVARANYSMPPDHGAAVVYEVLNSEELNALWLTELAEIREEIIRKRTRLANYRMNTEVFKALPAQKGMFSLLPIPTETTLRLRHEFGVYMTNNARINVLGVSDFMEERLVESISRSLV
jgi:aspartate/tyrosine/aromatic aminotransferase